jgi:hypothetical protein
MQQGHDFVIKACGAIADYQARGLRIRGGQIVKLILGGDDDIFELDDAATGQVSVRPSRVPAVQPGGDLQNMAALFTGMPRAQAVPEIIRFWRECERFARKLQPAIDALAEVLFACGRLSYSEASDIAAGAMADRPIPVLAEWLR